MVRRFLLAVCFLGTSVLFGAEPKPLRLDPTEAMTEYVLTAWRDTSGLPVDSVGAIAQTPDGYLWLATEHGLVRFDGTRFTVFTKQNTPAFRSNEIFTLFVSRDGTLWVGTRGGGAVAFRRGIFHRVPIRLRYIFGITESGDGAVWIAAPGGLVRYHNGSYTSFEKEQGYPGGRVIAVAGDATGVYVAVSPGIVRIDPRGSRTWTTPSVITSLRMTARGLLAGNEAGGVDRLNGDRLEPVLRIPSESAVSSIIEGASGSLWLSTAGGGIHRYANGALAQLTTREGLTSDTVNELLEDDEGNLWAASTGGGLVQLKQRRIRVIEPRGKLSGEWILPLMQARDRSVWFATNGGGLNHLTDDSLVRLTTADGLTPHPIGALAEDGEGSIWIGSDGALQRLSPGRPIETITSEGLENARVFGLTAARDGSIWVGSNCGLHHIVRGVVRRVTGKDGLPAGAIIGIREAADGSLWIARPRVVERYANGKATRFGRDQGLVTNSIYSIAVDEKDGSLWIATASDGLSRIRNGRVRTYRAENGLLSDSAYGIVQDREGHLWVPTGLGLYRIKRSSIDRFDAGGADQICIDVFRKADGLKSSEFSGGFERPGFRAFDGKLWFPSTRGLVVVDPEKMRANRNPPRIRIESIVANGVGYGTRSATIDAPDDKRDVEIQYTSPSYYSPETTTFRYMLEGFDKEWYEAGTRRTAYFTNVPPGKYRFRVQATTTGGVTRETGANVTIEPHVHENPLFKVAIALIVLLLIMVIHRRRIDSVEAHQAELRKSEEHFRSLIENGSDMILVSDAAGRIDYASPSLPRTLGLHVESVRGMRIDDLLADPEAGDAFLIAVRKEGRHSALLPFRDGHGGRREVEAVGATYERDGRIILNCRDVTDRRKLEAQLAQANRVASLGHLAATVSHEFNNVLMGIQPFVEIIRRSVQDRRAQHAASQIEQSVKRGKRITDEILCFTREMESTRQPLRVRPWLNDLEIELRALVGANVDVSITADSLTLDADVAQLNQVLTNLVINARDAGAKTIRLDIARACEPNAHAHLRVMDDGGGIPESILPHIFEPLFTTKTTKGTGLGLAVAQKIVAAHGGEIFVDSRAGIGTTFHLLLPLADTTRLVVDDDRAVSVDAPPCRIVLVEDDPSVAEGMLALLETEGFDVTLAATGAIALEVIPRLPPDLVILDIGLPDMSGFDVYEQIAKRWPNIRVIFSTGHGDVAAMQEHAVPSTPVCLLKPYTIDDLLGAIATVMDEPHAVTHERQGVAMSERVH